MPIRGTYEPNKRPVITTAPDCLVFLNGQLALPSGGNPTKKINIQPYVTGVSVSLGVENSPGNASISMHIPRHATDDFFRGGQLILTTMMEVRIYIKGHFLVGGAPRYYPAFWGVVTSVNHQWSGGERTVDLACQDILYWWTIQRININPAYLAAGTPTQGRFNTRGSGVFTGKNPFDTIFSLSRYAYGDAVNANVFLRSRQQRTEPTQQETLQLMAYWTRQWGRIAYALRMYGPNGEVIQGDILSALLSKENQQAAFLGRAGTSARNRSRKTGGFNQLDVDLSQISAFSEIVSRIGSFDLFTSEFQTKKEIADTAKSAIGYELFMDVTGEIIFKPPFYNLDVIPNKPVSWIRPIDIISESYAENPPDVTFLEGTGNAVRGTQIGEPEVAKPRATYVDYRLVAKYGWRPGQYNSEFFGAGLGANASRNLFFHLVDELDRQNSRIHTGQITIPIRPELRLGYPIFVESQDAYYYVEGISHNFSFAGNCTTSLTLMARRTKFYAAFPFWENTLDTEGQRQDTTALNKVPGEAVDSQAPLAETTDPNLYPTNLFARPIDPLSGNPVGDRNVILVPEPPGADEDGSAGPTVETFEETETQAESALRDLVSFRTQFRVFGDFDYVYQIDPNRDNVLDAGDAPLQSLSLTRSNGRNLARFPVSDERGYEVVGGYLYGRNVVLTRSGFDFSRQGDRRSKSLLALAPDQPSKATGSVTRDPLFDTPQASNEAISTRKDNVVQLDPNNYGRRLFEIAPQVSGIGAVAFARGIIPSLAQGSSSPSSPSGRYAGVPQFTGTTERSFRNTRAVERWRPAINRARQAVGVSAEQYPDDVILAFIAVESNGRANARRNTPSGVPSQYNGLLQIGTDNAALLGRTNTEFLGDSSFDEAAGQDSIEHFLRQQERFASVHDYDPDRLAITWKGGQGTTRRFNRLQAEGASDEELVAFLDKRWGTDGYVEEFRRARSVWLDPDAQNNLVEETEQELADLPLNTFGNPPEDGDEGARRASNALFQTALQANRDQGVDALPSLFRPVRDPAVLDQINTFLQDIYKEAFETEKGVEDRLRGLTQRRPRVNTLAQVPVQNPQPVDARIVDTPITRSEVQQGLEAGESLSEIFSQEGRWGQVEAEWTNAKAQFNRAGEVINPNDDEES